MSTPIPLSRQRFLIEPIVEHKRKTCEPFTRLFYMDNEAMSWLIFTLVKKNHPLGMKGVKKGTSYINSFS